MKKKDNITSDVEIEKMIKQYMVETELTTVYMEVPMDFRSASVTVKFSLN